MEKKETFDLPQEFYNGKVRIAVIGCGGTGSQLLPRLPFLIKSLLALGHNAGFSVTVWDDDVVMEHNCVRQNFFETDIGMNKAEVMVNRINIAHNLSFSYETKRFPSNSCNMSFDIIIGCVDSKKSRKEIEAYVRNQNQIIWIDSGNDSHTAQVIIGCHTNKKKNPSLQPLPLVSEMFPEIVSGKETSRPSCSARESLLSQGIATNAMAALWIFSWLSEVFQQGKIAWRGVFINLQTGRVTSIPVADTH